MSEDLSCDKCASDEDRQVTMIDVEYETRELADYIAETVGADDLTECSFSKGNIACQAIHICMTCRKDPEDYAGICSACSIECHQDHEVYPIGTKRYFRCECGSNKFTPNPCRLFPNKPDNNHNKYNHNFANRFCSCDTLHGDVSSTMMYQCSVCEDWFHDEHLLGRPPNETEDFVCATCITTYPFLKYYVNFFPTHNNGSICFLDGRFDKNCQNQSICLPIRWRESLCRCLKCYEMYLSKDVTFLLDEGDSASIWYEKTRSEVNPDMEDIYQKLTSYQKLKFDKVVPHFLHMKEKLKEYLAQFSRNNQVLPLIRICGQRGGYSTVF